MSNLDKLFGDIARKHLRIETLETRRRDSLDFHDVSVWAIRKALFIAYDAGIKAAQEEKTVVIEVLGGVAHVKECPCGVTVKIIDHDVRETEGAS